MRKLTKYECDNHVLLLLDVAGGQPLGELPKSLQVQVRQAAYPAEVTQHFVDGGLKPGLRFAAEDSKAIFFELGLTNGKWFRLSPAEGGQPGLLLLEKHERLASNN